MTSLWHGRLVEAARLVICGDCDRPEVIISTRRPSALDPISTLEDRKELIKRVKKDIHHHYVYHKHGEQGGPCVRLQCIYVMRWTLIRSLAITRTLFTNPAKKQDRRTIITGATANQRDIFHTRDKKPLAAASPRFQ